ncbi:nuclear transport factor 2 family protein [Sphingomonas sp. NSE70-1]|uniref:Nuclear transport factor 2 family protein n=1 Tax=Sphingomonas caseinilyticus TaxID=2908205 RepID=A0ABT0RX48_9SPHN|nr:nuclear transport factor 2 family protein [Sphingomonas caseinilyticus]MCL6699605.1 nuclear transport factor 2 family protein [Sphingomonas caseinilyticus]
MLVPWVAFVLAAAAPPQTKTPELTTAAFLEAFSAMDQARFDEFFAPDVTMFFPGGGSNPRTRVEGREAVLSTFHDFFKMLKEQGTTSLDIAPQDQRVQIIGDVAVVSFGLDWGDAVGRRSIVLRKIGEEWRIAHFHASTVDK